MTTFFFSLEGTLLGNPGVSNAAVQAMLRSLRAQGNRLIVVTGVPERVPGWLEKLVDMVWSKPLFTSHLAGKVVVVDDDIGYLTEATRLGVRTVAASQLSEWIAHEGWDTECQGV